MTTANQDQLTETNPEIDEPSELESASAKAVSTLFGIGRLWAAHGLGVGRSALDASAATLRSAAELLGDIGDRFDPEDEPAEG